MKDVIFSTGNAEKFGSAVLICKKYGFDLIQNKLDIDEIQGEDAVRIISDKATKAFALTGRSTIVSDDSWTIPSLNGFPGPYMKSVNSWFTTDDFLNLMHGKDDRRILLDSHLAFIDEQGLTLFHSEQPGTILHEAKGIYGTAMAKVVSMDSDDGKSISEIYDSGNGHETRDDVHAIWHEFASWYRDR